VFLVMLSMLDEPVSSSAVRSRPAGAFGALVSIVMFNAAEDAEVLPDVSVALAVTACVRLAVSDISIVQLPVPSDVVVSTVPS